tara:strand:- start:20012 stop:20653 length:642 start_codon:yes stop_codon:yes gene_type:complete
LSPDQFVKAARLPSNIPNMEFGNWRLDRFNSALSSNNGQYNDFACLRKYVKPKDVSYENMHRVDEDGMIWDVVMEDSLGELRKHLPIWMIAKGHVLKTGLGLGCVVRGLLIKPDVTRITVVEIDPDVAERLGEQFQNNPRVEIVVADALDFDYQSIQPINYAWHDIWVPENKGLQTMHAKLMQAVGESVPQGAWDMSRSFKRLFRERWSGYIG